MDFVVFCNILKWDNYTRRPHYEIIPSEGKHHLIVVLNPLNIQKNLKNFRGLMGKSEEHVIQLKTFLPYRLILKNALLLKIYLHRINKKINSKRSSEAVVNLFTDGIQWPLLGLTDPKVINCFDLTDAHWLIFNYSKTKSETLLKNVTKMVEKSDVVFCTANHLKQFALQFNRSSFYLRNLYEKLDQEEFLLNTPDIDVGYIGNINEWLDLDLIEYIIQSLKHQFVFYGFINGGDDFKKKFHAILERYENVRYEGAVKQKDLYQAISRFKTAMIPYKVNHEMLHVNPNKFYQYLSLLKPIVLTRFNPDFNVYDDMAYISDTKEQFVHHLNDIVSEKDVKKVNRSFAGEDAYSRFKERLQIIERYI